MHTVIKIFLSGLITSLLISSAIADNVGLTHTPVYSDSTRPLDATIWYATEQSEPQSKIADNIVFKGTYAVKNAAPKLDRYPLVLLSHGYHGNWRNLNWLATRLVQQGYLVAAVDHPGTSSFRHDKIDAEQWWERPVDISRLLTWLQKESDWQASIDDSNISVIGHSLGGWTVMLLAGATVDYASMRQYHDKHPSPLVESVSEEMRFDIAKPLNRVLTDRRIQSFVSLDLGGAHSFSDESLEQINRSVLVLSAGIDIGALSVEGGAIDYLSEDKESGHIARKLPRDSVQYKVYPEATHFSFVQLCKPNAYQILEEELSGDGIICLDGTIKTREQMHDAIYRDVSVFLTSRR
ncbi:alpha/beta hydrolase family protein [Marinomonas balearica]|uniref:Putative dienelactone hydrolase n=1 Tax=Marinomonas balearica TaxID=491947 RepID=A0A4R6M3L3_9GAMM|nr:alpha/beta fold hydrolase [Marinomonas balearica]TDO95774.1 putative dienelactone hydrolase [Marinomonas balearica]